jgi:hypothetical protein
MADENQDKNNEQELFQALSADLDASAQQESWVMLNEVYRGLIAGGFSTAEAMTLLERPRRRNRPRSAHLRPARSRQDDSSGLRSEHRARF